MPRRFIIASTLLLTAGVATGPALSEGEVAPAQQQVAAAETSIDASKLLTASELQNLVAPVALFPDTLLIQILIAATQPFDVMKADRLLLENEAASPAVLQPLIEAEGYDASVAVLAEGFPDVVHRMADNIDWTETVGEAMLLQSDDVLAAVQVMRAQAINTGALATTEQQVVSTEPSTNTVVIQPADPQVVYVPQYDPLVVYDPGFTVGNAVAAGLITWGTFAVIDEIFDDNDDWNDYWGCRNCAGWGGAPIIRNPDIDIDVDGNVNIGNEIGIDRDTIRQGVNTGDITFKDNDLRARFEAGDINSTEIRNRIDSGDIQIGDENVRARIDKGGWSPNEGSRNEARAKLETKRSTGGAGTLAADRPQIGGTDELRTKLSTQAGTRDIQRPQTGDGVWSGGTAWSGGSNGALAGRPATTDRPDAGGRDLSKIKERSPSAKPLAVPKTKAKPAAKPKTKRPEAAKAKGSVQQKKSAPKIAKSSSGRKAKASSSRGKTVRRK